jgi:hypothetical protein
MHIEKRADVHVLHDGFHIGSRFSPPRAVADQRRVEAEIGEIPEFGFAGSTIAAWRLARKPDGSVAHIQGARLLGIDRPGVYRVVCEVTGRWTRTLDVCVFTTLQMYGTNADGPKPRSVEGRLHQRGWLNDPGRTDEQVITRLESR